MILADDDRKNLREIYVYANTPMYLYRQLQASSIVQRMAREESTKALFERIRAVKQNERNDIDWIAIGYAALVAATMKDDFNKEEALKLAVNTGLDWAKHLLEIGRVLYIPSTRVTESDIIFPRTVEILSRSSTNVVGVQ